MNESSADKKIELDRYENRAQALLAKPSEFKFCLGSDTMKPQLRKPYLVYEQFHRDHIKKEHKVLEIGSGTGLHTYSLLQTNAQVTATDISPASIEIIKRKYSSIYKNLQAQVADIEQLPFGDEEFNIVCCAGSLSYGNNELVLKEISRVLKTNGLFISVDSLHNNPIYIINRWLGYWRGRRSLSTIKNMFTINKLSQMQPNFKLIKLQFFGALSWLSPVLTIILGEQKATVLLDRFDQIIKTRASAFKFVLLAKKSV